MNQIENYIKYELDNPTVANNIVIEIINKINNLKYFPYVGSTYKNTQSRFIICKNFLIFYQIQGKLLIIKTIIHKKRKNKYNTLDN